MSVVLMKTAAALSQQQEAVLLVSRPLLTSRYIQIPRKLVSVDEEGFKGWCLSLDVVIYVCF